MNALYHFREWIGLPPALLVVLLLAGIFGQQMLNMAASRQSDLIIVQIESSPPDSIIEPPMPEPKPPIATPAPKSVAPLHKRRSLDATVKHESVVAREAETISPSPSPADSPPQPSASLTEPSESAPAPPLSLPSPEPERPSPAPAAQGVSLEDVYIGQLRASVQSRKRYPTGREASLLKPSGTVRACMTLDRHGVIKGDIHISRSSQSMMLDAEAKKLLRLGAYPPFPAEAFAGQDSHQFCINLEYSFQSK